MNIQDMIGGFLSSEQGQHALGAVVAQGIGEGDAKALLGKATEAAVAHIGEHQGGLLGAHAASSFLSAFAAGIAKGDGLLGSLEDGALGTLVGRVAEALTEGGIVDPGVAATISASITPFLTSYLKKHLSGG